MPSREQLLRDLRARVPHPATAREIMRALDLPKSDRVALKRQLTGLVQDGELVLIRGIRYGLADRMDLVVGRLETHAGGFGFVTPERTSHHETTEVGPAKDVFVPAPNLDEALHGDRVVVRIERHRADGRAEGRVVQILERRQERIVGRLVRDDSGLLYVQPFDARVLAEIQIPRGEQLSAEPGEMVTVLVTRWGTATRGPVGRVVEVLGDIDDPGVDTEIVLRKHGIVDEHPAAAVVEAERLGTEVRPRDLTGRTDFRSGMVVTIDGEHARDFDDAVAVTRLANGHYWLGVHIADVAHYVQEGSALDAEAYERGTSVYFPERAVHMFPEALATGLCSLRPHVDRLVQSCLMEVNLRGDVVRYELHDGIINSAARMTYTEVNAILTGEADARRQHEALVPHLERMRELFEILNARRRRRGSVDFDLPEAEVVLDEEGLIENIVARERNVAHRLIEEFMLLANETVAAHLEQLAMPALYRVHEAPDPLKVMEFDEFVTALGFSLGALGGGKTTPVMFQKLVDRIRGTAEERPIAFLMLRTMQKARYDATNLGHFGLAAPTYTHFTSPIRRYPDLVVHRMLREVRQTSVRDARRDELNDDLPEIGRHTSEREVRAAEAEREILQWKKVRFMADKVGESFDGYVTGVAPFGLFVELVEHFVEGLVHVSTMADDYYRYSESSHMLAGENTKKRYRLGDAVVVQVVRVDHERRQIELALDDILAAVAADSRARGRVRSRTRVKSEQRKGTPEQRHKIKSEARRRKQRPGRRERTARKR